MVETSWSILTILIVLVIPAIIAVVLCIALISSRESVLRFVGLIILIGGGGMLLLLGGGTLIYLSRARQGHQLNLHQQAEAVAEVERIAATRHSQQFDNSTTWDTQWEREHLADQYSSAALAAAALAKEITPAITAAMAKQGTDQMTIQIDVGRSTSFQQMAGEAAIKEFSDALQTSFPQAEVSVRHGVPMIRTAAASRIDIDLGLGGHGSTQTTHRIEEEYGHLRATVLVQGKAEMTECRFEIKPWIHSVQQYAPSQPQRLLVAAYSGAPVDNPQAAHQLALADARRRLGIDDSQDDSSLSSLLVQDKLQVDRFTQKLSTPEGDLWREAILLDLSDQHASRFHHHVEFIAPNGIETLLKRVFGFIGLVVVTIVLYLLLKILTQGSSNVPAILVITGVLIVMIVGAMLLLVQTERSIPASQTNRQSGWLLADHLHDPVASFPRTSLVE